ncbi:cupin domain-containing protein [bacterium]|nr:cupin domain-containing protein [bacterium]
MIHKRYVLFMGFLFIVSSLVFAQNPESYSQLDPKPYDPKVDANIDLYMGNWKESMPFRTHGSLIERDVLTRGDPMKPTRRGAVLKYVNRFTHATLDSRASTTPVTLTGEQEIFYIISGNGTVTAGKKTAELYSGVAVLMPANLEFTMKNTGDAPLTMYLVAEPCPEGFRPNKDMLVVDENTLPVSSSNAHWVGIVQQHFTAKDGLGTLESVLTCSFDPMTFFQPHSHDATTEEVWVTIDDDIHVLLGKQIRLQPPGTAYMIPPDGKTPHANFNVSDRIVKMFYFARYRDHEVRK